MKNYGNLMLRTETYRGAYMDNDLSYRQSPSSSQRQPLLTIVYISRKLVANTGPYVYKRFQEKKVLF